MRTLLRALVCATVLGLIGGCGGGTGVEKPAKFVEFDKGAKPEATKGPAPKKPPTLPARGRAKGGPAVDD